MALFSNEISREQEERIINAITSNVTMATNVNIESIITNVMNSIMPTMAEAIAKAVASTMNQPIEQTHIEASTPTAVPEPKAEPSAEPTPMEQTVNVATIFEYSDKCWALVGTKKEDKDIVHSFAKEGKGVTFINSLRAYYDKAGWLIAKSAQPDMNAIGAVLSKHGYTIEYGESVANISAELKAKREAEKKAATPTAKVTPSATPSATPAPKKTKTIPMVTADFHVQSFVGVLHDHNGKTTEGKVTQIPTLHDAYYCINAKGTEEVYIYTGTGADGKYHFLDMGKGVTFDTSKLANGGILYHHENMSTIASKGLAVAYSEGIVKEVYKFQADAYRAGGNESVADYLAKVLKTAKKTA